MNKDIIFLVTFSDKFEWVKYDIMANKLKTVLDKNVGFQTLKKVNSPVQK